MQSRRSSDISMISAIVAGLLGFWASPALAQTSTCDDNGTVKVCLEWSKVAAPVEGNDFSLTYNGAAGGADVELLVGDLEWRLWTTFVSGGAVADFGAITLDPTVLSDDFEVTIANGTGPGAAKVKLINLKSPSGHWTGYSSLEGASHITGPLDGPLTVVKDSGGVGGELTLTIDGDVSGAITAAVVNDLTINGDLSANLTVIDLISPPGVDISGNVGAGVTISIGNMVDPTTLVEIGSASSQFEGQLVLLNGLPRGTIRILSDIGSATSTPQIDLNNRTVAGRLECLGNNEGNIVNGYEVKNLVTLASGSGNTFSGTATFLNVRGTGRIDTTSSADLNGTIRVTTNVDRTISISGDLGCSGKIWIEGHLYGNAEILVGRDLCGDVVIDGTQLGDIIVEQDLQSVGRILVNGLSSGTIGIGQRTRPLSLIHLVSGLDDGGTIEINQGGSSINAEGTIHIGTASYIQMPDVTFDGCIHIYADSQGVGGSLNGSIFVLGCHATSDDLNICIDGNDNGNVAISQSGCTNQVDWSCDTCPE